MVHHARVLTTQFTLSALLCFAGIHTSLSAPLAPETPPVGAHPSAFASSTTMVLADSIRAWIKARRFTDADSAGRVLVLRVERESGSQSLEAARSLDLLVETRRRAAKGTVDGTLELAERAVRIKERFLPADDLDLAESRAAQADVLIQRGEYAPARTILETVLDVRTRVLGPDDLVVATTASLLGTVLRNLGDLAAAGSLKQRALAIRERQLSPTDLLVAGNLNDLANIRSDLGEYDEAEALYLRAIGIREQAVGDGDAMLADWLTNLGRLRQLTGDYGSALAILERALAIQKKVLGPDDRRLGNTLTQLGLALAGAGDRESALERLESALKIREDALGMDHVLVGTTLDALAGVVADGGDRKRARSLLERALAIRIGSFGPRHAVVATTMHDLANVLVNMGEEARAESLAAGAVSIWEEEYGPKHHLVAEGKKTLAKIRARQGDWSGSVTTLEEVRATEIDLLGPRHPDVASTEAMLAEAYGSVGDSIRAFASALHSEMLAREHLRALGRILPERTALRYGTIRTTGLDVALTLAERGLPDSLVRDLFDAVIRSRAIVLDEAAARRRNLNAGADTSTARLMNELAASARRLSRLLVRGPDEGAVERFRADLGRLRGDEETAERALAERSEAFERERETARTGLADVISGLPPRSALAAFVRFDRVRFGGRQGIGQTAGEDAYGVFVLANSGGSLAFVPLGDARSVESLVRRWRLEAGRPPLRAGRTASQGEAAYRARALALRRAVWDPVVPRLRGADRVYVIADAALQLVAFAALPDDHGGYIVESGPLVHYLSSERDIAIPVRSTPPGPLVAVGGPSFDRRDLFASLRTRGSTHADERLASAGNDTGDSAPARGAQSNCAEFRTIRFGPLPATQREVADVVQLWRSARPAPEPSSGRGANEPTDAIVLTGREATEATFKALAPRAEALHLATHGFFLSGACPSELDAVRGMGEVVVEADPGPVKNSSGAKPRPRPKARATMPENPLLLSGLALAGANHREAARGSEEDGIVTAQEVAAMDLSRVRWAVLSACDTGVGETTVGEGILGLRRAFQVAGARTVVMSLWSVEDRSAQQWMKALYDALLTKGFDTAGAVREASRAVLADRVARKRSTHPFYWAGFVAAGDWR